MPQSWRLHPRSPVHTLLRQLRIECEQKSASRKAHLEEREARRREASRLANTAEIGTVEVKMREKRNGLGFLRLTTSQRSSSRHTRKAARLRGGRP